MEYVKIGVIAAIFGALLIGGLALEATRSDTPTATAQAEVEPQPIQDVTIIQQKTLEMLSPEYSEKAVFADEGITAWFKLSYDQEGEVETKLSFRMHNCTHQVIAVNWERCSMQLPDGHTWNVRPMEAANALQADAPAMTSVAPNGDLFQAVVPVPEIDAADDGGYTVSSGILDDGPFTFVLALDVDDGCEQQCQHQFYTFRFIIQ